MKTIHAILALVFATLLVSAFSFAAEPEHEVKHRIKLKIVADDDLIEVDAADMEVGETRQSFTESGKEVVLTRLEEGYKLEVDGEEIDVGMTHGEGHHQMFHFSGDEDAKVMIRTMGGEEGREHAFIHAAGDEDMHWLEKGEDGDFDILIRQVDPAEHLLAPGVLDDLSEEKRQEILDALREMEPHQRIHKKIIVDVEDEIEEGDGDG